MKNSCDVEWTSSKGCTLRSPELGLPTNAQSLMGTKLETWSDVPPATIDFFQASKSLKAHVAKLVEELEKE
jgi:hypothetical protein